MALDGEQAERRLHADVRKARRSRIARLATHPWRLLYPRLLRTAGLSQCTSTKTFWEGRLNVVLPEAVSTHIWRYGFFEEDVCLFMLRSLRPTMSFIDVGAHFGFFTLLASALVGNHGQGKANHLRSQLETVLDNGRTENMPAFEIPVAGFTGGTQGILIKAGAITAINAAAYSSDTTLTFHDYGLINSGLDSAFSPRTHDGRTVAARDVEVNALRLDDIVANLELQRIDLIKIDAESSEAHVLQGAAGTIETHRPRIILEVGDFNLSDVVQSTKLVEWLRSRGYNPYEFVQGNVIRHNTRATYSYGNLLFVHEESA